MSVGICSSKDWEGRIEKVSARATNANIRTSVGGVLYTESIICELTLKMEMYAEKRKNSEICIRRHTYI